MYVLDASVILKWYLQEESSNLALAFRQKYLSGTYNLALPDLILYEISNALKHEKSFSIKATIEAVEALIDLGIDLVVPTKSMIRYGLEVAYENKITFYDAAYISLAHELGYNFVTADEKLFKKTKNIKFINFLPEITP